MKLAVQPTRIPIAFSDADTEVDPAVSQAASAARAAQSRWSHTPLKHRLGMVREFRMLLAEQAPQLAAASASARGRPAIESLTSEVLPLAEACRFLERQARAILSTRRLGKRGMPLWLNGIQTEVRREPLGVILIIGPGNYPLFLPGVQLIQSLTAGNAAMLKPGIGGTPAARALIELLVQAGFDPKLMPLLPESSESAQAAIRVRPDKVLFTGSAATGETLLAQLAPHLVASTMELSGCDAVIVRADADLDLTVKALVFALRLNGGATCMAPKRVFVHRGVATGLEGRLALAFASDRTQRNDPDCAAAEKQSFVHQAPGYRLRGLIEEALRRGAYFVAGDELAKSPVILGRVDPGCDLLRSDIFAPVLSIVTVADDHEAILRANDCPFALSASIFSRDECAARSLAGDIHAGTITINDLIIPTGDARVPFGGRARSGFGVTRGPEGLLDLTSPKVVAIGRGAFRPAFQPTRPGDDTIFNAYLKFSHGRSLTSRGAGLASLLGSIYRRDRSCAKNNP